MSTPQPAAPARTRVLIVEDDEGYARLVGDLLDGSGSIAFHHDHAGSVADAVDRLARGPYDIVLLDLGLPDARDLDALRTLVPLAPEVPIVVLSGAESEELAIEAVKAGAQDYLLKTQATADVLSRSIRYALERKRAELETKRVAYRDMLTELPNRFLLMEHLNGALKRAARDGHATGVCFIDIDHFKHVNDRLGHAAGDEILRAFAVRLLRALRGSDTLARLGGDEFVAVVDVGRKESLALVAEHLLDQLRAPFVAGGQEVFVTASIGISAYPADGADAPALLRAADRAMYRAKAEGRDTHRFYDRRLESKASRITFSSGLRRAIERGELLLHFQPVVNLQSGRIDAVEALVRWKHPGVGLVPPADFIPIAEESGLILSIERWVLRSAMTEVLAQKRGRSLRLAVNLSTRHFDHPELLAEIKQITREVGFDPRLLELELTERGLMHQPRRVLGHLRQFRRLGITVAVDDFGTGYSCLGMMKQFPLNALKIDRSFVRHCATDPTNRALVSAVIRMGHALGLTVTAEGVENTAQLAYLRAQKCDRAQGFYFTRPVPRSRLAAALDTRFRVTPRKPAPPRNGRHR